MSRHARLPLWREQSPEQKLETLRDAVLNLYRFQLGDVLARLTRMLDAHEPADEKEARDIQRIKQLIAAHPDILSKSCEIGHITASALIIDLTSGRALLHFHRRLGRWLQVGGHAEYETELARAALREALEETGLPDLDHFPLGEAQCPIDYDVHTIPQSADIPQHLHLDFRYLLSTRRPDALAPASGESTQFRWLSSADALGMGASFDQSLRRLLGKAFARLPSEDADQ